MTALRFELVRDWERPGFAHEDVAAVAVDSRDRVYLHTRNAFRVSVHHPDGTFIGSWGDGVFAGAHGITIHADVAYVVDDRANVVRIFHLDGELLGVIGEPGVVSDTGYRFSEDAEIHHNETIERVAGPFNGCCNVAVSRAGDIYVADGYGNARIHRFSPDGELIGGWGEIGTGPGQFHLPHGIAIAPDGAVVVADRENDRLQFFDPDGGFLSEWTDVQRPTDVVVGPDGLVYVAELWRPLEPGQGSFVHGYVGHDLPGRVSVFDQHGCLVARWGDDTERRAEPGNFIAPHGLALDSEGSLYVAEVPVSYGARPGRVPYEHAVGHQIQKFRRV